MHAQIDKNKPSAQWIEHLRERYPTEKEIDRILTRRLHRRSGPGYSPLALQTLVEGVRGLIQARHGEPFEILEPRWLSGGASKLQMAFVLDWHRPEVGRERTRMVLRMEPAESIVETSRLREFQLLLAVRHTVPVPPVFWCDDHGEFLPYPALERACRRRCARNWHRSSSTTWLAFMHWTTRRPSFPPSTCLGRVPRPQSGW